ncbi:MAG: carboxypeptidase regulatory-like domain-containing protein [Terracidiphilus sp.]
MAFLNQRPNLFLRVAGFVLLLGLAFLPATAQQTTGSIVGTVKDQQGAVVNTATVRATNVNTGFSRTGPVNGYGEYRIDYLPVGKYSVEATAPSFERFVQQNITLDVDQTVTVEVKLTVGAQTQTVTVTEAPPLVNTSDAVLGRTIETDEIIGLPLVNRNAYAELSLTPGVMANSNSPTSNPSGTPNMTVGLPSAAVQVNGSLDSGNGTVAFYLDGGNNITGMRNYGNPAPNPDALDEFRVETSAFDAQYGQFSGAVVTVLTKSGTNKFHGGLFEFNRNTDFNAFSWTPTKNPFTGALMKSPYHRNNFGGTFGGPVKHDKAFFFFSYAGLRQVQAGGVTGGVTPTAAERLGDFTADINLGGASYIYMPGTKKAVPVNGANDGPGCAANLITASGLAGTGTNGYCIPKALLDTTAANFLNINNKIGVSIPLPTGAQVAKTGGGTYIGMYTTPTNSDEYLGKYDENIGDKDHLTGTYFYIKTASTPSGGGNINWTGNQSAAAQTNLNLADVHTFSGSIANQTWLTFTRAMGGRALIPVTGPANQTLGSFGSNFLIQGPAGLPYLNGAGFSTGNPNAGPVTGSDNYELRDVISMTKGKHNLSLGGEFALDKTMFAANLNNYGDLGYSTSAPTTTGNAIADFVTGQLNSFEQDSTYITHLSTWHTAVFAQDNYRITPRFTANIGLRWDIDTPPVDAHNRTASFVPGQQSTITPAAPLGQLFVGDKGVPRGLTSTSFSHISPRIGFAWDPFGDGKTSIRAAAGIFYGSVSGNEWNQPGNAMPFSIRNGFGNETSMTNIYNVGFPSTAPGGGIFPYTFTPSAPKFYPSQSIEAIPSSFKDSSVYQFNFSVQRQLPYKVSLTAAYVSTLGRHLSSFVDANYAPYATVNSSGGALVGALATSAASTEQRRQYDAGINLTPGTVSGISYLISDQTSNYNGLQVSAAKSMSKGFSVSGFFVWSRALEGSNAVENGNMSAQDFGVLGKPFTPSNNSMGALGGGLGEERGPMDQNHDLNAAISGMWKIDYFHGSNRIVKEVVNGWQISPVVYLISGAPFTVNTGSNKNFDSQGSSRPNMVAGVNPKLDPHRCRVCGAAGQSQTSVLTAWFNNAAFTTNGPGLGIGPGGADGTVGRDSLIGPGLKDMDAGLFRNINFERGLVFQFRAEVTNVMNWVSLSNPSAGNITSGNQGTITSAAGTQRVIQLGGRLTF